MQDTVNLLMIEDSGALSEVYKGYLEGTHYNVVSVNTLGSARVAYDASPPDIVLLDIELPDGNGMDFLAELRQHPKPANVIVMTAYGTSNSAVQAVEAGASDFLTKPFDANRLLVTLNNVCSHIKLTHRAHQLSQLERNQYGQFIGSSLPMQTVYKTIESLAASKASAFIIGESGTGKELAADAIHQYSARANSQLVALNCGAIPAELMESELFGHIKGAFTGASSARDGAARLAHGGTLFLDEVCEMSLELQKKLLRFIQTGTFRRVGSDKLEQVDVRFICATNKDPLKEVKMGRFREDLFYRLHVVPLRMPPLRERDGDILMIAEKFLRQYSKQENKRFASFSDDASRILKRYLWPGNVRQLQNAIHQVVVLNDDECVHAHMLPAEISAGQLEQIEEINETNTATTQPNKATTVTPPTMPTQEVKPLWLVEKDAIENAIRSCEGNVIKAAALLEVAPSTLYRKRQGWNKAPQNKEEHPHCTDS